jgi:hypothetical protein
MRRFLVNRWWALILMLGVLLLSSTTFPARCRAVEGNDPIELPGGNDPPAGDPDAPAGKKTGYGRAVRGGDRFAVTSVGDGRSAKSIWVWRLHVVLQSLIARYSR